MGIANVDPNVTYRILLFSLHGLVFSSVSFVGKYFIKNLKWINKI